MRPALKEERHGQRSLMPSPYGWKRCMPYQPVPFLPFILEYSPPSLEVYDRHIKNEKMNECPQYNSLRYQIRIGFTTLNMKIIYTSRKSQQKAISQHLTSKKKLNDQIQRAQELVQVVWG